MKRYLGINVIFLLFIPWIFGESHSINFINPRENVIWMEKFTYNIQWQVQGLGHIPVTLELYQGNEHRMTLGQTYADTGNYPWIIPDPFPFQLPVKTFTFTLKMKNPATGEILGESPPFFISDNIFTDEYPSLVYEYGEYLPVIVGSPGAYGSSWKTDLYIQNPLGDDENPAMPDSFYLFLFYIPEGRAPWEPPLGYGLHLSHTKILLKDVVSSLFNTSGAGLLLSYKLFDCGIHHGPCYTLLSLFNTLSARVYNDTSQGTFGMFIKAAGQYYPFNSYRYVDMLGLQENEDYRSNLIIANVNSESIDVYIYLIDDDFNLIGQKIISMEPYSLHIERNLFTQFTDEPIYNGSASFFWQPINHDGLYILGTVIDNHTGAPYPIPLY